MSKTKEITIPSSIKSLKPVETKHGKDVYLDNPFLESFCVEVRKKSMTIATGLKIKDESDNDVQVGAVAIFREVDTEEFLKIYTQNIKSLFDLSSTAQRILMPLMLEIQKNARNIAHVYFSFSSMQRNCKILNLPVPSKPTFSRAISELIEKQFIAVNAEGQSWYWINPNILFNGDRIRFIQDYRLKRKTERVEEQQLSLLQDS